MTLITMRTSCLATLPAGIYKISFRIKVDKEGQLEQEKQQTWWRFIPAKVTFFTFRIGKGFDVNPPPTPTIELQPLSEPPPLTGEESKVA